MGLEGHLQEGLQMTPVQTLEAPTGFEPVMEVLQTSALPLGYGAKNVTVARTPKSCQLQFSSFIPVIRPKKRETLTLWIRTSVQSTTTYSGRSIQGQNT